MTNSTQLLGISNAIVDILAHVDHALIEEMGIMPGSMNLIDEERAHEIYNMMGPATEMSGGSVANSVAGFANLGGTAAYIGRVKADQFGEIFNHDMRSLGIDIRLEPGTDGAPTARSHVLITSDGQRTMNTYLGACTELGVSDITADTVGAPKAILLEGYLWDLPEGPALARKAIDIAHETAPLLPCRFLIRFASNGIANRSKISSATVSTLFSPMKMKSISSCRRIPLTTLLKRSSPTTTCSQ